MTILSETLEAVTIGRAGVEGKLTVFPMESDRLFEPDYLTLDEVLEQGLAKVSEVSESGQVPELRFENHAEKPVLLVDGEELVGAKQNRVLNLTLLVPAREATVIPVSCVEAGRWSYRARPDFESGDRVHFAEGRSKRNRAVSGSLESIARAAGNQGEVWADIDSKFASMGVRSESRAAEAMYVDRAAELERLVAAFPPSERQVGAVFAIEGYLVGLELFDSPRTFAKSLPKIVRSYGLDALDPKARAERMGLEADDPAALVSLVRGALEKRYPATGLGESVRLEGEEVAGGALEYAGRIVHLAAFAAIYRDATARPGSRYARASQRSRHYRGE